jgi:uncharacterized membrane protein YfcA
VDAVLTVPLGFALGFLIGLTGIGGGALVAPSLYVLLGMTYPQAVGMSLIYSAFTKVVGFVQHLRQGNVAWKITLMYGLTGIPGAVLGSVLLHRVTGPAQRLFPFVMGGLLLLVAVLLLLEAGLASLATRRRPLDPDRIGGKGVLLVAVFSSLVGLLMGATSIGSGSLIILSMVFLFRMSARRIVGSNIAIGLILVVPAGLTHFATAGVDLRRLGLLMLGSLFGAVLGSKATMTVPDRTLKFAMAILFFLSAFSTLVKAW